MNLHLFFEGMQAREEVASAFFASLLEQQPEVRNELFDILADSDGVGENPAEPFKVRSWRVRVEVDGVDVRLDTKDEGAAWVILIENKLQSGSMQVGQLRRYYASQIERDKEAHVVAVYLCLAIWVKVKCYSSNPLCGLAILRFAFRGTQSPNAFKASSRLRQVVLSSSGAE